jgi:hypothetical protein
VKSKKELVDELWALKKRLRELEDENERHRSDIARSKEVIANGGFFEPLSKSDVVRENQNITDREKKIEANNKEWKKLKPQHDNLWTTIKQMT